MPLVGELVLVGRRLQLSGPRIGLAKERAIDGTSGAPGADDVLRTEGAVDGESVRIALDVAHVVGADSRAAAAQQEVVELEAADGVLHGGKRVLEPLQVHDDSVEGIEPVRVRLHVEVQIRNHLGSDPARTELGARELLAIEHQHRGALPHQPRGARRAGRASADDDDVDRLHRSAARGPRRPRIDMSTCPRDIVCCRQVRDTTWKSWMEFAKNAAEHPARYSRHARMNSSSYIARTVSAARSKRASHSRNVRA